MNWNLHARITLRRTVPLPTLYPPCKSPRRARVAIGVITINRVELILLRLQAVVAQR